MASQAIRLDELPRSLQDELHERGEVHLRLVVDNEVLITKPTSIRDLFGKAAVHRPLTEQDIEAAAEQVAAEDWGG